MNPVMTSCPPQPLQKSMLRCPRQTTLSRGIRKRLVPQVNYIQPPLTFPAELPLSFPLCQRFPRSRNPHVNISHSREPVLTPANAKPSRTLRTNTAPFSSCTCWNVKWTWYLGFHLLASLWDNVSRQTGHVWLQRGSGFSEVFVQPSSHHGLENIPQLQRCLVLVWVARTKDRISFVLTGLPRSGSPLTLHCNSLLCFQHWNAASEPSTVPTHVSVGLWTCCHGKLQNYPFQKWTELTVLLGKNKKTNKQKIPNPTHTTHKKNPKQRPHHYIFWLSLCSPIAAHKASASRGKQGTDVGWLKNLSLPLFYWLVTTEKFALIYFKSKWLDLHKTGGKSQFLMRTLNKDSV